MAIPLTWQEWHAIAESRGQTVSRLAQENAELRELLQDVAICACGRYCHGRGGRMSAENDLALAYHMGYDDALAKRKPDASKAQVLTPYDLATENNKLRELVRKYGEFTDQDRCEGCVYKSRCNDGEIDECWQYTEIRELARELGVEV